MEWTLEEIEVLRDLDKTISELKTALPHCSRAQIYFACRRFGLRRSKQAARRGKIEASSTWTADELNVLSNRDLTFEQLTELIPQHTLIAIKSACRTYGFPRNLNARTHGQELSEHEVNQLLSGEFLEIVNGHLLGDGSIGKDGIRFSLSNTQREYADFTHSILNRLAQRKGTVSVDKREKTQFGEVFAKRKKSYKAVCSCKQIFEPLRKKWYTSTDQPDRFQKVVPQDLEITPLTCNRWYVDDGYINVRSDSSKLDLYLCTDGFIEEDVDTLLTKLQQKGIAATKHKGKKRTCDGGRRWRIYMYGEQVIRFLDYIGGCPVECYKYKWDVGDYQKREYECKQCSTPMTEWGFGSQPKKLFCSKDCLQHYHVKRHTERNRKAREKRNCIVCGKEFIAWSWSKSVASNAARTCGESACVSTFRKHRRMRDRNLLPFHYECAVCGQDCVRYTLDGKSTANCPKTCGNPDCKKEHKRCKCNVWHREWRSKHREEYNAYMRLQKAKRAVKS